MVLTVREVTHIHKHTHIYIHLFIYLFIYLLYKNLLPPQRGWHTPTPRKEGRRKEEGSEKLKKRIEAQRAKPRTPTSAIDALIGEEEQTGKKKGKRRKKSLG